MEVFVINLEESTDRKKLFDEYNSEYIGNYNYFNAVNGKKINISELSKDIIEKNSINYSNSAIGCALSHLNLWNKCIELNKPIIIMEDDVIVNHDYKKHFSFFVLRKNIENLEERLIIESFLINFCKKLGVRLMNDHIPEIKDYYSLRNLKLKL
jgi:glycosyl transferase family 25